jgi:hypothetical protein
MSEAGSTENSDASCGGSFGYGGNHSAAAIEETNPATGTGGGGGFYGENAGGAYTSGGGGSGFVWNSTNRALISEAMQLSERDYLSQGESFQGANAEYFGFARISSIIFFIQSRRCIGGLWPFPLFVFAFGIFDPRSLS